MNPLNWTTRQLIGVRAILTFVLAFLAAPAFAQLTYSPTYGGTYTALDGATVSGKIAVRLTGCAAGPWVFAVDGAPRGTPENICPFDLLGDNGLLDTATLAAGAHTITATGSQTYTARFTVSSSPLPPPPPVVTGSALVSWTPPTTNTDGSALTTLAGYRVYFGTVSPPASVVQVADPKATSTKIPNLAEGTWYFAVEAYTSTGAESAMSQIVSHAISGTAPPPPTCTTPQPAAEMRSQTCPTGTTGMWVQTRTYAAAPYPTCWTAGEWLPATAPDGSCTAAATWTVRASTSGTRPAYELVRDQADKTWVRGYKLGDIAVGKPCDATAQLGAGTTSEYHKVAEADVVLLSPTYRGRTLVAVCARQ